MDNKPRSHECVLSHPYCSSLQKISSLCLGQNSIPISNTPIRDLNGSPSLHKSGSNSNSSSTHTVYSDSFLSTRFFDQGFRSTISCFPNGNGNSAFSKSGFFDILEEVGVDSFSEFLFLREHYRTDLCLIFPPEEKFVSLCQRILLFQHSQFVTARQFSQLLGFLNSLAEVIPLGRLHIRPLQFYLLQHWLPASQDWEAKIPLLPSLLPHLLWWINRENVMKSLSLSVPVPILTLHKILPTWVEELI